MAAKYIKCFRLRFIRVTLSHAGRGSLLLVVDDLATALIEVDIEEDHLLNAWHVKHLPEVKVYFVSSIESKLMVRVLHTNSHLTYSFLKSLSENLGIFAITNFPLINKL